MNASAATERVAHPVGESDGAGEGQAGGEMGDGEDADPFLIKLCLLVALYFYPICFCTILSVQHRS